MKLTAIKKSLLVISLAIIMAITYIVLTYGPSLRLKFLAKRCAFKENLIGSIYSGKCMIPGGPMGKTFLFFGNSYFEKGGKAISDVYMEPSYWITDFQSVGSREHLLLLKKAVGRDDKHGIFLVLDYLRIPQINATELLMYGGGECKLNGENNDEILAIAKSEGIEELKIIRKAWRANKALGKFEEIAISGVTCIQDLVD